MTYMQHINFTMTICDKTNEKCLATSQITLPIRTATSYAPKLTFPLPQPQQKKNMPVYVLRTKLLFLLLLFFYVPLRVSGLKHFAEQNCFYIHHKYTFPGLTYLS